MARKEGNQSVISDVIEGETASSLINVHRSIFLKIRLGSLSPPRDVHSYMTDIVHVVWLCRYIAHSSAELSESNWKWHFCHWWIETCTRCHCWRGASDSAVISAVPTFPLGHKQVSLCSRLEKEREDGESLITLYLLTFPLPPRGEQKAALIQTDKLFDKKEERHNSICLGPARPRWGLCIAAASSALLLLGGDKNRVCWPLIAAALDRQMLPQLHIVNRKRGMSSALPPVI